MNKFSIKSESESLVVGAINQRQMKIDASSSVFTLLSEGLYTNPSYSAFSEILSNAWDAHIDADRTDIPVRIKFDDQMITITDSGLGIPHDKFEDLYETLGGTSKANDLTKTGGMGIGKFAPFSVADSFIVKNSFGGICKTYALTKGSIESSGFHTTSELSSVPCENTGFEVSYHDSYLDEETIRTRIDNMKLLNINVFIDFSNGLSYSFEPDKTDSPISFYSFLHKEFEKPRNKALLIERGIYIAFGTCLFSCKVDMEPSLYTVLVKNGAIPVIRMSNEDVPFFTPNRESLIDCEHNTNLKNKASTILHKWWNNNKHIVLNRRPQYYFNFLESLASKDSYLGTYLGDVETYLNPLLENSCNSSLTFFGELDYINADSFLNHATPQYNISDAIFTTLSYVHGKRLNGDIPRYISLTGHKLYRKVLRFMTDKRWGLESFVKPNNFFVKSTHHGRDRTFGKLNDISVFLLIQRILLCKKINIYNWSDTNYTHECVFSLNVNLRTTIDKQEFIDYIKKLNPYVQVNIIKPIPKEKGITTRGYSIVKPKQRFQTLGDYLNYGDTFDKLRGKYFIKSSDAKFVRDLLKTPSLHKRYISGVKLNYPVLGIQSLNKLLSTKEFLEEAVIVELRDLERYSKRKEVRRVRFYDRITESAYLSEFPGLKNLIEFSAASYFSSHISLNGKPNNIYRLLHEHEPTEFPRLTPAHFKDLIAFIEAVLSYGYVSYYGRTDYILNYILDRKFHNHVKILVELNNTKLFSPLVAHLKGKSHA